MIDILLPYYGDPCLMRRAVESVLVQTRPDWRLVIVDDHNPDTSLTSWLTGIDDSRVTYLRNSATLGVNQNFRRCLELARAPYVSFMGCDDIMLPDYVETVLEAAQRHPEVGMIQPRVRIIDADGNTSLPLGDRVKHHLEPEGTGDLRLGGQRLATSLLRGAWTYFPAICWRRDLLQVQRFRPEYETVLDLALLMDLVVGGVELLLLDGVAFEYRRHPGSASSRATVTSRRFAEERALFDQLSAQCTARGWPRAARAARWHLTSRLHAVSLLPAAVLDREPQVVRTLVRHAFSQTAGPAAPRRRPVVVAPAEPVGSPATADPAYAQRLITKGGVWWKRVLDVQAPYRWNLRRHRLGRTLDVGCGIGRNLATLEHGSVGVDHNEASVQTARRRGLDARTTADWKSSSAAERGSFDSILLAHVVEHMDRGTAVALLEEYLPYLRPGGQVLLICPQERGFASDPTHIEFYPGEALADLARTVGLVPGKWSSFPFPRPAGRVFTYNEFCLSAVLPPVDRPVGLPSTSFNQQP